MLRFIGVLLILFAGFFIAGMFRPLLTQLVTNAQGATLSGNNFALAMLATFGVLPLVWVFVRGVVSLRDKE